MLTVHHLGISQSERIVWLCEELGIAYKLQVHTRAPLLAPDSLKSLPGNSLGKAPFIVDDDVTLSESGAICDYIIAKYGNGKLAPELGDKNYVDFLYWYHYANATLQPLMMNVMFIEMAELPPGAPSTEMAEKRLQAALRHIDEGLAKNKWLAGDELTTADILSVYSLTTQRYYGPLVSLKPYGNIVRYLSDVGRRPAYKRAMELGDPEMEPLLRADAPSMTIFATGGIESDVWRKSDLETDEKGASD
ncbi:glutathione S-transferas-like protein [Lophiostoma macrostomum CBS 122681]|uniref:Glutathione S-transferas-like protein n=1 Tax=Lophiostoma macrostomum CBS 122681 TaxID=1314788 RepID=A0A6A6SP52_9PLEO|nr:glutathione S-transferas-like protein [Lophiostoma macrostomum CBS 122681]